jgi:hypothetical protein
MDLQNERKEEVYVFDLDCTPEEEKILCKMAIRRFAKDKSAQLNYAIKSILSEYVDESYLQDFTKGEN